MGNPLRHRLFSEDGYVDRNSNPRFRTPIPKRFCVSGPAKFPETNVGIGVSHPSPVFNSNFAARSHSPFAAAVGERVPQTACVYQFVFDLGSTGLRGPVPYCSAEGSEPHEVLRLPYCLRACYAIPCTDVACDATRPRPEKVLHLRVLVAWREAVWY